MFNHEIIGGSGYIKVMGIPFLEVSLFNQELNVELIKEVPAYGITEKFVAKALDKWPIDGYMFQQGSQELLNNTLNELIELFNHEMIRS